MNIIAKGYEYASRIFLLLTDSFQHLFPNPARLVGIQPKGKGNNHFKIVERCPTSIRNCLTASGISRIKCPTLVYRSDGGTECRGNHPE